MLTRLFGVLLFVLSLSLVGNTAASPVGPVFEQHVFIEDFTSTGYMDAAATTADWNVIGRVVRKNSTDLLVNVAVIPGQLPVRQGRAVAYAPETGKAYIFGGSEPLGAVRTRDVVVFDPMSETATVLPDLLPVPMGFSTAVHVPELETIFLLGNTDSTSKKIWAFDARSNTITDFGNLARDVFGVSALYVPEHRLIYYFGGIRIVPPIREIGVFDPFNNVSRVIGTELPVEHYSGPIAYLPRAGQIQLYGPGNTYGIGTYYPWILQYEPGIDRARVAEQRLPVATFDSAYAHVAEQNTLYIFDTIRSKILMVDLLTGNFSDSAVAVPTIPYPVDYATGFYAANRHAIYMFGDGADDEVIYRGDFGYVPSGVAQSRRINEHGDVYSATLTADTHIPTAQSLSFEMSNDGGQSWQTATPGVPVIFSQPDNDLRWRATFNGPTAKTAYLNALEISYTLLPSQDVSIITLPIMEHTGQTSPPPTGSGNGINGLVTYQGVPAAGIPIELRFFDGTQWLSAGLQNTDGAGRYQFINKPSLQAGQAYYVRYGPNASIEEHLYVWLNNLILSYQAGERRLGGNFDVATVELIGPNHPNPLNPPFTFVWQVRPTQASEAYDMEVFYPGLVDIFFGAIHDGSFRMEAPVPRLNSGQLYGWSVWVNNQWGTGVAFDVYLVKFGSVEATVNNEVRHLQRTAAFIDCLESHYRPEMTSLLGAQQQCNAVNSASGN